MSTPSPAQTSVAKRVVLRNLMRRRPVLLYLPGGRTLRLGPNEAQEVDAIATASRDCARFCRDGLIRIEAAPTAPPAAPAQGSDDINAEADAEAEIAEAPPEKALPQEAEPEPAPTPDRGDRPPKAKS